MLNHHSLNLLIHLSVFAFLGGEYLVNNSKNVIRTINFTGTKARTKAVTKSTVANFSLACAARALQDVKVKLRFKYL